MTSHAGHGPVLGIQVIINTRIIRVRGPHTETIMIVTMGGRELKHLLKCSLKMMDLTPEDCMDQLQAQKGGLTKSDADGDLTHMKGEGGWK